MWRRGTLYALTSQPPLPSRWERRGYLEVISSKNKAPLSGQSRRGAGGEGHNPLPTKPLLWYNIEITKKPMPQTQPYIPSAEQLYDTIMEMVEPELLTAEIPKLKAKYEGENPDEARERSERYKKAFAEYEKISSLYFQDLNTQVNAYRHEALASAEAKVRDEEMKKLSSLESAMS